MMRHALAFSLLILPHAWAQTRPLRVVSLPATSHLSVSVVNGSVLVETWDGPGILVRAEIPSIAADQVVLHASPGVVSVVGPSSQNWSVKLRIDVPPSTVLTLATVNGNTAVHGVESDVVATAVNGNIQIAAGGAHWAGQALNAATVRGNIVIAVPADCAAQVTAAVVKGAITTDFPVELQAGAVRVSFGLGNSGSIVMSSVRGNIELKAGSD